MNAPVTQLRPDSEVAGSDATTMPAGLAKLREPFPENLISRLPKPTKAQTEAVKADFKKGCRCVECGSWHHPDVVHLDYVGHAALTDRLLDVDPFWSWEPAAVGTDGLPAFDRTGGLWIRLTVCGVTRLGYGHANAKPGQDLGAREKEVIGDALRNAAMRFGAALDLWHKGDLHAHHEPESDPPPNAADAAINVLRTFGDTPEKLKTCWADNKVGWRELMTDADFKRVKDACTAMAAEFKAASGRKEPPPASEGAPRNDLGLNGDDIPNFD